MIQATKEVIDDIKKDAPAGGVSRRALPLPAPGSDNHIPESAKQPIETPDKTIRFLPVFGKNAIRNFCNGNLSEVINGFDIVLGYAGDDINFDTLFNEILNGNLYLWVIFVDNKYAGFMTVAWELKPFTPKYFDVRQLFVRTGEDITPEAWAKAMKAIEGYAKSWGFEKTRMFTNREGWEKKLKKFNWKKTYTVYEKDLRS